MSRTLGMGLWILCVASCTAREAPSEEPATPEPVEVLPPEEAGDAPSMDGGDVSDVGAVVGDVQPADNEGSEPQAPRDLGSELAAAVGDPVDCLRDYRPSTAKTIPVQISAVVRSTGLVIEPSANGPGLSNNDRQCIADRVGAVTLPALSGGESVPVTATLSLQYRPEVIEEYDVGGPAPKLKDVVEPLPKKPTIPPSGVPIEGPKGDPIEGPKGDPIEGPKGIPVEGPKPMPIEGYQVDQEAERWTDQ